MLDILKRLRAAWRVLLGNSDFDLMIKASTRKMKEHIAKLPEALYEAREYSTVLEKLRAIWVELLNAMVTLKIPLPPHPDNPFDATLHLRAGPYKLTYEMRDGKVITVKAAEGFVELYGLMALLIPLENYLFEVAMGKRDAEVLIKALSRALSDKRLQAALAIRKPQE